MLILRLVIALASAISAVGLFIAWKRRAARARRRQRELDEGKRCLSCDGTDLAVADGKARCADCGYVTDFARLRETQLSDRDISDWTRPNG